MTNNFGWNCGRVLLGVCLSAVIAAPASAVVWDGDTANPGDWNDAANWTTDSVPGSGVDPEAAVIGDASSFANPATVNLAAEPTIAQIGDLRVGNGFAGNGTLNHSSGTIAPRVDKWSFVGVDGDGIDPAVGTYNLSGDAAFTLYNATTGPFNSNEGNFFLGIGGGRRTVDNGLLPNQGTLNVTDTATFVVGNLFVGNNDDNEGTLNQDNGTVVAENWVSIGRETGAIGEYNMTGGQLAVTNDGITVGESTGATGTFNISGASQVDAPRLRVGRSLGTSVEDGGGTGFLNIMGDNADITVGFLDVGSNDGVLTNGEGTLSFSGVDSLSAIEVLTDVTLNDGSVEGFAKLEVDLSAPGSGDIELIDIAGTLTGTFMGLAEGDVVPGTGGRTISYMFGDGNDIGLIDPNGGGLPLLGDADGDGDVDGDDLIAVQTNFGSVTPPPGDADGDGDVDGDDLIAVQTNFGNVAPGSATSVPEPVGLVLIGLAIAPAMLSRKRS